MQIDTLSSFGVGEIKKITTENTEKRILDRITGLTLINIKTTDYADYTDKDEQLSISVRPKIENMECIIRDDVY